MESLLRKLKQYIKDYGPENVDIIKKVKSSSLKSKKSKSSLKGKILNPATGRYVLKTGKIGKELISSYNNEEKNEISDFIKAKKHSASRKDIKAKNLLRKVIKDKLESKKVKFTKPLEEKRSATYKVLREFPVEKLRNIAKNLLLYPESKINELPKSTLVEKLSKIKPPIPPNLSKDALHDLELEEVNERPSLPKGVFDIVSQLRDEEDNNYGGGRKKLYRKTPKRRTR